MRDFFIEDIEIEYVVVDLEENAEINLGDINLDNPKLGSWINNIFVENSKVMYAGRDFLDPEDKCHIVLTHVEHKPLIIGSSHILSAYWRRLEKAFEESSQIILFGYSGYDEHLNNRIKLRKDEKELLIVEWEGAGSEDERKRFWETKTGFNRFELVRLENILEFTSW